MGGQVVDALGDGRTLWAMAVVMGIVAVGEQGAGDDDCLWGEGVEEVGNLTIVAAGDDEIVASDGLLGTEIAHWRG